MASARYSEIYQQELAAATTIAETLLLDEIRSADRWFADYVLGSADPAGDAERIQAVRDRLANWRGSVIAESRQRVAQSMRRWERGERAGLPFMVYRSMQDGRVRPMHARYDGTALAADHAWWSTHYPPNGYGCRCRAWRTDAEGLRRLGISGAGDGPAEALVRFVDRKTGEMMYVPEGIDPGWDVHVGKEGYAVLRREYYKSIAALRVELGGAARVSVARHASATASAQVAGRAQGWKLGLFAVGVMVAVSGTALVPVLIDAAGLALEALLEIINALSAAVLSGPGVVESGAGLIRIDDAGLATLISAAK